MRRLARVHRIAVPAAQRLAVRRGPRAPQPGPVRILLLNAFGMGGTIRTSLNLAAHLSATHDVELVSLLRGRDEPFFALPPGVRVRWLHDKRRDADGPPLQRLLSRAPSVLTHPSDPGTRWASLWSDLVLARYVSRLRGGVLITTRPAHNAFAARFAPGGVTLIGQEHMNLAAHAPELRDELQRTYPRLDLLTALTRGDAAAYAELLGDRAPRIEHVPNAVPPLPGDPRDAREPVVVSAGRLQRQKGFDLLIPAFAPVARAHPEWKLRIYGEGPEHERLEALIEEHGLAAQVRLCLPSRKLGEVLSRAAVFALSSRHEGFPMVLIEAMSKAAAVVSFDCPTGPADALTDGHDGLLAPPEDIGALSAGLERVVSDADLRRRLGAAARETAGSYSIEAIGGRWVELLSSLGHPPQRQRAADRPPSGNLAVSGGAT